MFKGSALYPPGAIDRVTQGLGGTNNAFTSHDVSAYHFQFERRSWGEALLIEADRMRGLNLLPEEIESEREVILEEIRMVEDDPWDILEQAVALPRFRRPSLRPPGAGHQAEPSRTGRRVSRLVPPPPLPSRQSGSRRRPEACRRTRWSGSKRPSLCGTLRNTLRPLWEPGWRDPRHP